MCLGMQTITNGLIIPLFEEHYNDLFMLLYITCMCVENTSVFYFKKRFYKVIICNRDPKRTRSLSRS